MGVTLTELGYANPLDAEFAGDIAQLDNYVNEKQNKEVKNLKK